MYLDTYGVRKSMDVIMIEKICNPDPDMYIVIAFMGILKCQPLTLHGMAYFLEGAIAISHAFLTFKSSCSSLLLVSFACFYD